VSSVKGIGGIKRNGREELSELMGVWVDKVFGEVGAIWRLR
jgi:hypothetical protein